MADQNVPWATDEHQFTTGTQGGAPAPSPVTPSSTADVNVPWGENAVHEQESGMKEQGSMWESIKSNMGARVDALAASMLEDEGSDRSRYALKRAERSNQEARANEEKLTGLQQVGVGAVDIGSGLALGTVNPALAAGYFTAQGTADQLRQQAEETGRYDLQKAAEVGIAQGVAAEGAGRLAGQVIGRVAPNLANKFVGQAATATTGGAGGGASMQMISNIANGKDIGEGVGAATLMGAAGGLGAHGVAPAVRAVARAPTTLRNIQEAGAADFARRNPNLGQEPPIEQPTPRGPTVAAEEGAIPTGAEPTETGAIPTPEQAPESQWIPGTEEGGFNPSDYGEYRGPSRLQPGQGFGPGAPTPRNPDSLPQDVAASPRRGMHMAQDLWKAFKDEGLSGLVSPKGVKQMSDAELTSEKLGLRTDRSLINQAKETEGSVDIMQQQLEGLEIGSPEYMQQVNALSNLSMQSGSAAAHTRANALALDTGMPMTAKFHDVTLHEGVANENTPRNIARDVHGMSPSDINAEHRAVMESRGSSILGSKAEEQSEKFQTFESHYNATNKAYKLAKQKVDTSFNDNYELALRTRDQLSRSEQPELYQRAQDLTNAMDDLRQLKTQVSNGDPINTNKLATVQRQIIDHGTALGLTPKFKNVLGEAGTFNPTLDLQAWHNFNTRTRQMHTNAPKGSFKDTVSKEDIGLEGLDVTKPGSWLKPVTKIATSAAKRHESVTTQAKGAAMAREATQRPVRASEEYIQNHLKNGDTASAEAASEVALNRSGINTEGPELGATPAQEIQSAAAPTIDASTQAHVDTLLRGSKGIVDAQNAEAAAGRAARPVNELPPEAIHDTAPLDVTRDIPLSEVQRMPMNEVEAHMNEIQSQIQTNGANPELNSNWNKFSSEWDRRRSTMEPQQETAPEGPGAFAEGNVRPTIPEGEAPVTEAPVQPEVDNRSPRRLAEPEPEVVPETAPVEEVAPARPEVDNRKPRQLPDEEAAPIEEPEVAPKTETEEAKVNTEEQTQKEVPETDKPVNQEQTDFKSKEETAEQRNKRVSDMAKKMVKEKTEKVIKAPAKKVSIEEKAKAEGMRKGVNDILDHAKDVAAKEGVHEADILHAVMSQEGGLEATFKDGFGKDAIKGRVNTAVKAYKTQRRQMAQQAITDAKQIIRRRLGEAKVGATREAQNDRIRANLKSSGLGDSVINKAFDRASAVSENYTPRQVAAYAKQLSKEASLANKPKLPENDKGHIAHSRKALYDHVDTIGVDTATKAALRKVINNYTQPGASGKRPALTESEQVEVLESLKKTLKERSDDAKVLTGKMPAGSKSAKRQSDKAEQLSKASSKAEETLGTLKQDLNDARISEAETIKQQQAAEKRYQESEAKHQKFVEDVDNRIKQLEADKAKAVADAKDDLRKEAEQMPTDTVEEFGKVIAEDLPDSLGGTQDASYQEWKNSVDVAAETLRDRGRKHDADFLSHLSSVVDKGLKRLEELPDHPDLVITQTEYNQLRDLYNKVKKQGDLDIEGAANVQMGTVGIKLRTLLLGDANARNKIRYNSDKLNSERRKALDAKNGTGEFGEGSSDIVVK